jgi:choline dehydrogenase
MPIFRELETSDQLGPLRGRTGPLHVRTVRRPHALTEAFVESACACGHPFNEDYNGAVQAGVAYAQLSQRNGLRCSAADAFLKPLLGKKNIKLVLNASAQRIELANSRAVAVAFSNRGNKRRETARDIIVCVGAIASPKLLMLSGIGDPEELGRHNIDVVVDLPGVGRNLNEHPLIKLTYRTKIPTYNLTGGLLQKLGIAIQFVKSREGPISNLFEAVAFLKSSPSEPFPDIQLHFLPAGYLTLPNGAIGLAPYPSVTVLLNKSLPKSCGRTRLTSRNPEDAPLIECRLLEDEADVDTMVQGVKAVRRIMATEPMASLLAEEITPGPHVESVSALKAYVRDHTGIAFHPAGTCRMGTGTDAVVGPDLRVRGTDNLWISDASIMPDLISGNTNAGCMMIGVKLGRYFNARDH